LKETFAEETFEKQKKRPPYLERNICRRNIWKAKETAAPYIEAETFVEETFEKVKETTAPVIDKVENFTGQENCYWT
jgi:hypothetical protein